MNQILQEIKMSYRSFISYTLGLVVVYIVFLSFFGSFRKNAAMLEEVLRNFPPEFKAAFGFSDVDLSQLSGYLSFLFGYIVLIGAIYAMKLGTTLLSEEVRSKTADFLLTKPVTRTTIVTGKLITILFFIGLQNLIFYTVSLFSTMVILNEDTLPLWLFTCMCLSILLVQLFFVGIGMLFAAIFKKIKSVMPIALGVVFVFYILEMINASIMDPKLAYVTPFSYFKGSRILENNGLSVNFILIDLCLFVLFICISYFVYNKKDIDSV